jgi:hemoglobin
MPKMIHFWSFVLLNEHGYTTNVVEKHLNMPLQEAHFERWLNLFYETIDEHFSGEIANQAKQRAQLIGWTIKSKIQQ